jgi:3-methyladenine DNA glycosylase AlkD
VRQIWHPDIHYLINMQQLKSIQKILRENAKHEAMEAHKKFVPGIEKMYGVRMPVLNQLAKQFRAGGSELVEALWKSGSFEEKILAAKMLQKIAKQDPQKAIRLVNVFSKKITDWAVCDTLGMQSLKAIVKTHSKEIFALAAGLNKSKNVWQRRLSLVLVEWYTRDMSMHPQINVLVKALEDDEEYYVKKAVEWIKRNMYKGK